MIGLWAGADPAPAGWPHNAGGLPGPQLQRPQLLESQKSCGGPLWNILLISLLPERPESQIFQLPVEIALLMEGKT